MEYQYNGILPLSNKKEWTVGKCSNMHESQSNQDEREMARLKKKKIEKIKYLFKLTLLICVFVIFKL